MMRESDYYRSTPEPAAESTRWLETPPNLRVITQAVFVTGQVCLPRAGAADPVEYSRQALRETVAYDGPLCRRGISWSLQRKPDCANAVAAPGWSSTVFFYTEPPGGA